MVTSDHSGQSAVDTSRPGAAGPVPLQAAVRACLAAAILAPSVHNSQPWLFRLRGGGVDVLADRRRRLDAIDPLGRELLISVGAAVLNLRVAVFGHGRLPILRIFPDQARPDLVAHVVPGPATLPDPTVRALVDAIPRRHTNRRPFSGLAVPGTVVDELAAAAAAEGATLAVADPVGRDAILALVATADGWQRAEAGYRDELTAWTVPPYGRPDGVPSQAFGPRDRHEGVPLRDFGLTQPQLHRREATYEAHPTIVVIRTYGDDRHDWVRAGQALQRVLLTATVRGVATTPMTQALEIPEIRQLLSDPGRHRYPQLILRLGYGRPAAASPRRPLADVLLPPLRATVADCSPAPGP
jgi:nitroreductase